MINLFDGVVRMEIKRIDSYSDSRFSPKVLKQHGAFEIDGLTYEVEIISDFEAIIRGSNKYLKDIIEEFRYYAEHIWKFYNEKKECVAEYAPLEVFDIEIIKIQPSQFYVDIEKKAAVSDFINNPQDIVIPLVKRNENYVSLDGHTRLSVAIDRGFKCVKGFITDGGNWVDVFVNEAMKRGIKTPYDMKVLEHEEYDVKWNKFCDELFEEE